MEAFYVHFVKELWGRGPWKQSKYRGFPDIFSSGAKISAIIVRKSRILELIL